MPKVHKSVIAHVRYHYLNITETFIYQQLINLKNFSAVFFADRFDNLDLFPYENLCSTKLKRFSWLWFWNAMFYRIQKRYWYLEHLMKSHGTVLIHAHYGTTGVRMVPVKKRLGLPLITTFYGYDVSELPRQERWRTGYKDLFHFGDKFLVEGTHFKKTLNRLGCPEEKIIVQHLGINLKKFRYRERMPKKPHENIQVLFCGSFREKKGLIYALEAIKSVIVKHPNLEFRIIGDGDLRPEIEKFTREQSLENYVILLGYKPYNIYIQELNKADILLQPSVTARDGDTEGGAPMVLLEAQATGLPVISTIHCDIPEYVINGKTGFLEPERNSPALAERLTYLIENQNSWAKIGQAGRKHVERNYNVFREVGKLEKIYAELLEKYKKSFSLSRDKRILYGSIM